MTVSRTPGQIPYSSVPLLQELHHAESVIATDLPIDAVNGALGEGSSIAVTTVHGDLDQGIRLIEGRLPGPGEVIIPASSVQRLNLDLPAGYLQSAEGAQWSIVGAFTAQEPYEHLDAMALSAPEADSSTLDGSSLHQVRILADSTHQVRAVQAATLAIIGADPTSIQVDSAAAAADTTQRVTDQFAGFGRSLLLLILGAGAFFVAIVVLADVLIRRRDLGRRRTLGITRSELIALVALRTTAPALSGAVLGTLIAQLTLSAQNHTAPWEFSAATALLATLTATIASLTPATYAAHRDPVAIMRTA
ncbi:FtsX-like permease family protein [Serinibacter salmoneus]|uniref:FtsX-like permease family protein n=1 Tax=Serinibacter salmoneus TaxID=556530 RepID=UPI001FEA403E|nr:FtsX-like permease family protein [Serinibacter salmoneus]